MKKNKNIFIIALGILTGCLLMLTIFLIHREFHQAHRKISSEESEEIIPLGVEFDLSRFDGVSLSRRIKYRIFENAKWIDNGDEHQLVLGNAKFKNSREKTTTLCDAYSMIELVFQAEGIAIAGDAPKIVLRTSCESTEGSEFLNPISIPWKRIKNLKPKERNYKEGNTTLFFRSLDDFWPLEWSLFEMRLYPPDGSNSFQITGYDVIAIHGEPLNFFLAPFENWP